ncbi:MAG: hypothetical protein DRJ01_13920 [Bacteroidetes bacterium]|nr:MAG: hypothetical protein DRJ01_13920 [Bacteroidota bacterium]
MNPERVYYYSKYDGAGYSNMQLAEKLLANFKADTDFDINDILELYQVKLYIDNEVYKVYLTQWTEEDIIDIKEKCKNIWSVIVAFWNNINSDNISELYTQLESWILQESFWELTAKLSVYKNISKDTFAIIVKAEDIFIRNILYQEKLVKYYGSEIRNFLLDYDKTTELLLSQYVAKKDREHKDLYFPKSLNQEDREVIILSYLDNEDANLNYIRQVLNIKDSAQLSISDKTRLKAKKLEEKQNKEILDTNGGVKFGIEVGFSGLQDEPFVATKEDSTDIYTYGTKYILKEDHPLAYLSHFISLFGFINEQRCISLVSKNSEFSTMEKVFMNASVNEYPVGMAFNRKEFISLGQISLYDKVLIKEDKPNIEQIIKYYIAEHLNKGLNLAGFHFNLPSNGTSYFEKIRTLLAEFDVLLRKYKLYKEEGEIDYELLAMSSKSYSFSQIPSFVSKKYCYLKGDNLNQLNYLLFSDQSGLSYVEPFKSSKYFYLYEILINENVLYDNYKSYQKSKLEYLIEEEYLIVDNNGFLKFKNDNQIFVLRQLYREGVISYWHYSEECRNIIDRMEVEDLVSFEDTLFNKLECNYFNYYLNDKEFTNGLKLRNRFVHGTNPDSENELIYLYYVLLRIIVLTILKIDDDLTLSFNLNSKG